MRLHYDEQADAMYLRLDDATAVLESEEVQPGIVLEFNAEGQVVGIEILRVQARFPKANLRQRHIEVA